MSVYPDSGTQTMPEESNARPEDLLARHQFEIERMKDALALLGVVPCFHCRKFLRRSEPGAIFDAGDLICYGCIPEWWPQRSAELGSKRGSWSSGCASSITRKLSKILPNCRKLRCSNCRSSPPAWNAAEPES